MHVLVADDEASVAELLASVCARGGHRVDMVTSADAVLEYVRAHRIDLLIVDLDMPGVHGIDLVRQVRQAAPELPFVAMTPRPAAYPLDDLLAAGGVDLLRKPFTMDQLGVCLALVEERRRYVADLAAEARDSRAATGSAASAPGVSARDQRGRSPILLFERLRDRRRGAA